MKAAAVALAAGLAAPAFAAGGHHAVDDAAILDAGQCEVESWFGRSRGGEKLLHAGAGCRVGPVELGAAAEHARQPGAASQTGWQLQAKWAAELAGNLSVGVSLAPSWAAHARPRYQGATVAALATWKVGDAVALHANLGRDLVHRGDDASRSGVAAEWSPAAAWTLLLERYTEERGHFVRAGARWALRESFSVDLSRAHRLSGAGDSGWTLGVTWLLER